jgi:hypothetical protein
MAAYIGAETGNQGGCNWVPVGGHIGKDACQVGDVGQHDGVGDQACVFQLLFLLDGVAALDHRATEGHPVQKIIVGLDLGGFSTDAPADLDAGEEGLEGPAV